MLLINLIQVTESISGSVVPLAMFCCIILVAKAFQYPEPVFVGCHCIGNQQRKPTEGCQTQTALFWKPFHTKPSSVKRQRCYIADAIQGNSRRVSASHGLFQILCLLAPPAAAWLSHQECWESRRQRRLASPSPSSVTATTTPPQIPPWSSSWLSPSSTYCTQRHWQSSMNGDEWKAKRWSKVSREDEWKGRRQLV